MTPYTFLTDMTLWNEDHKANNLEGLPACLRPHPAAEVAGCPSSASTVIK